MPWTLAPVELVLVHVFPRSLDPWALSAAVASPPGAPPCRAKPSISSPVPVGAADVRASVPGAPVLIAAFRAGTARGQAHARCRVPRPLLEGRKIAEIDPELFVDFQATRPHVSLDEEADAPDRVAREHVLPDAIPGTDRDAVVLVGVEPNYRWRTFTDIVADLACDLGVELVVTLGRSSRTSPIRALRRHRRRHRSEAGRRARPAALSRYEGPTGIVGVLLDAHRRGGIPSVSLWAAVLYSYRSRRARVRRKLGERLSGLLGIEVDVGELAERRPRTSSRSPRRSRATRRPPRTSKSSSSVPTRSTGSRSRARFRRARRSQPRSPAFSASETRTAGAAENANHNEAASFTVIRVLGCVFGWFRHSWCRVRRVAVRRCLERRGRLSLRLALPLAPASPRLAGGELRRGEVVGEGVRDLGDRAEFLAGLVERRVRPRRVAVRRGEGVPRNRHRHRHRDLDEAVDVLLVPVAAWVRRCAEEALCLELRRHAPVLHLSRRPGELPRPAREDLVGSRRLAFTDCAKEHPDTRCAVGFSQGGAWVTRVTRSSKSALSTGVATRSRSAVIRRRRFGFSAAQVERNCSSATLLARPSTNFRANSTRWSKRICLPAMVAQKRCSSSSRYFGSIRCHSRWITASRRATSGVTGTGHGTGESLRRARRCCRRRGGGGDTGSLAVEVGVEQGVQGRSRGRCASRPWARSRRRRRLPCAGGYA